MSKDQLIPSAQKNVILKGTYFKLTHNIFSFEGDIYKQIWGTAMGTPFALNFANLFMGRFKEKNIYNERLLSSNIVFFKCYIDDLIFIWKGVSEMFQAFVKHLNRSDWGLSFTLNNSPIRINFFDFELSKGRQKPSLRR